MSKYLTIIMIFLTISCYGQENFDSTKINFFYKVTHLFKKHKSKIKTIKKTKESNLSPSTSKENKQKSDTLCVNDTIFKSNPTNTDMIKIINDTTLRSKPILIYVYNSNDVNIITSTGSSITTSKTNNMESKKLNSEEKHKIDINKVITVATIMIAVVPTILASLGLMPGQ